MNSHCCFGSCFTSTRTTTKRKQRLQVWIHERTRPHQERVSQAEIQTEASSYTGSLRDVHMCVCVCAGRVNHSTRPIISCGFCSILYWQHKKGSEKEDNRTTWWHSSACYSVFGRLSFVSIKKDLKRRKSERFVLQSHRRYFTYTLQLLASFMYDKQTHF